jgi:hypothetical protein
MVSGKYQVSNKSKFVRFCFAWDKLNANMILFHLMSCLNSVIPSEDIVLHSNEMFKAPHSETKFAQIYLIPSEISTRTE